MGVQTGEVDILLLYYPAASSTVPPPQPAAPATANPAASLSIFTPPLGQPPEGGQQRRPHLWEWFLKITCLIKVM